MRPTSAGPRQQLDVLLDGTELTESSATPEVAPRLAAGLAESG